MPGRTTGMCDYPGCADVYCIETQLRIQGFRDDVRKHLDDDKNGNERDGDNVGGHKKN